MPMSLRANPQKKELFEPETHRPAKKVKTSSSTPPAIAPKPPQSVNINSRLGHDLLPAKQRTPNPNYGRLLPKIGTPRGTTSSPAQSLFPNSIAALHLKDVHGMALLQAPTTEYQSVYAMNVPTQSSVPSLTPDAETSEGSPCSDSEKFQANETACAKPVVSERSRKALNEEDCTVKGNSFRSSRQNVQSGNLTGHQVIVDPRPAKDKAVAVSCGVASGPNIGSDMIDVPLGILKQTYAVLKEMEDGRPDSPNSSSASLTSRSIFHAELNDDNRESHATVADDTHSQRSEGESNDVLWTPNAVADNAITSIVYGIITELSTSVDHCHGLNFLMPQQAHHQYIHRQRFVDCLNKLMLEAEPKVNVFLNKQYAAALAAVYKYLERRIPKTEADTEPPPPSPPPGHMVVRHSLPQTKFHLVAHEPTSISRPPSKRSMGVPPQAILPSNAPPLPKLAPKLGTRSSRKQSLPAPMRSHPFLSPTQTADAAAQARPASTGRTESGWTLSAPKAPKRKFMSD